MISHVKSKKVKHVEAESRTEATRVGEVGVWGDVGQRIQRCSCVGLK